MNLVRGALLSVLCVLALLNFSWANAEDEPILQVTIADPFIELHTGPGGGYPIIQVIDRGMKVTILKQRTNWVKITSLNGKSGWASRDQMLQTLLPGGEKLNLAEGTKANFENRKWLLGASTGEFENAPIISIYTAYSLTENISAEATFGKSVGNVSSSEILKVNLLMQPFPDASYSPYFTLGTGNIKVQPNATLISENRRNNNFSQVGIGVQHYLNRRFIFRLEYNEYIIFSANNVRDENEDISEWKAGFAVFF